MSAIAGTVGSGDDKLFTINGGGSITPNDLLVFEVPKGTNKAEDHLEEMSSM